MDQTVLAVTVTIEPDERTDMVELDEMRLRLRERLLETDVHSVEPIRAGSAPPWTRGVDLVTAGALLVSLSRSAPLLKSVIGAIQVWAANRPQRSVELTIGGNSLKVTGVASAEQQRLIDVFIERTAHP